MEQQDSSSPPQHPHGKTAKILLAILLLVGAGVALYQVLKEIFPQNQASRSQIREWVNLSELNPADAGPSSAPEDKQVVRIAVAPIVSPEKSMETYDPFVTYVGKKLKRKAIAIYRPTYVETNDLVRYRRCDIAIVCTYPFIRGEKEFGMQALVVPRINGETTYQSVIIVRQDSPAKTLFDLRGKRFASADIISTTGWLFPAMLLMEAGENPNKFFGEHILTHSHDRALQAVLDGFVDGAAVHGIVYSQMMAEDSSAKNRVRVLAKSPPFGIPPVVAHPKLDPVLKKEILDALLHMHEDPEGKAILAGLQIDRFVVPDANLFDSLRLAVNKLENWR